MVTLDWAPFLRDPAVAAAYRQVRRLVPDKKLLLHAPSPGAGESRACWAPSREAIHIVIGQPRDFLPHAIVHELVHAILMGEGYHRLTGDLLCLPCHRFVLRVLSNEFQHPEVFRRMREEFGLAEGPYWARCAADLRANLDEIRKKPQPLDAAFLDFPWIYSWFFIQYLSAPVLEEYRTVNPGLYQAALAVYEQTKDIGFHTAERHRQCLDIFKRHWQRYCDGHLSMDLIGQNRVLAVRESVTRSVAEIANSHS